MPSFFVALLIEGSPRRFPERVMKFKDFDAYADNTLIGYAGQVRKAVRTSAFVSVNVRDASKRQREEMSE